MKVDSTLDKLAMIDMLANELGTSLAPPMPQTLYKELNAIPPISRTTTFREPPGFVFSFFFFFLFEHVLFYPPNFIFIPNISLLILQTRDIFLF